MPRSRDPENTRRRILNAAAKEFSTKGFHGTTISGVARRAAVSKQLISHHFGTKEALFQTVHEERYRASTPVSEILPDDPRHLISARYRKRANDVDYTRFLAWEAVSASNRTIPGERARSRSAQEYGDAILHMQQNGQLPAEYDHRMLQLAVLALCTYPIAFNRATKIVTGRDGNDPAFQRDWAEFLDKIGEKLFTISDEKPS